MYFLVIIFILHNILKFIKNIHFEYSLLNFYFNILKIYYLFIIIKI